MVAKEASVTTKMTDAENATLMTKQILFLRVVQKDHNKMILLKGKATYPI